MGKALVAIAHQLADLQPAIDQSISTGSLVLLLSVQTTSLRDASGAKVRTFTGKPKAEPDLDGGGRFRVDRSAPTSELKAKIKDKHIVTKAGALHVTLPPLYPGLAPIRLDLRKGRIEATCTATRCKSGRVGGAVPQDQITTRLIPAIAAMARAYVARDCPSTPPDDCPDDTTGRTMLDVFDANDDKVITDEEVEQNSGVQLFLAPDLDLSGDGEVDALSFGLAFTARWARIRGD